MIDYLIGNSGIYKIPAYLSRKLWLANGTGIGKYIPAKLLNYLPHFNIKIP